MQAEQVNGHPGARVGLLLVDDYSVEDDGTVVGGAGPVNFVRYLSLLARINGPKSGIYYRG
jgi:hypothetical protein